MRRLLFAFGLILASALPAASHERLPDMDAWFAESAEPADRNAPDFEMVMEQAGKPEVVHTIKRHAGWIRYEQHFEGAQYRVSLTNQSRGLWMLFFELRSERPQLVVSEPPTAPAPSDQTVTVRPKRMDRPYETVLGERCAWFDMAPNMADGSRFACRTGDGIVLKEEQHGRGGLARTMTAVRFERRPVRMDEIRPAAELFARVSRNWPQ